jgi:hypothetical protein
MSEFIPKGLREKIVKQARNRCGYCLSEQLRVYAPLEIDPIISKKRGGETIEENLWLACPLCNRFKGHQMYGIDPKTNHKVRLFNPRTQKWRRHFKFSQTGDEIIGKTIVGRSTVVALQLNNDMAVDTRKDWVKVGWYPPKD